MAKTDQILELFDCLSRLDLKGVLDIGNAIADGESKQRHDVAANKIRHALRAYEISLKDSSTEMAPSLFQSHASPEFMEKLDSSVLPEIILSRTLADELESFYQEWREESKLREIGLYPRNTLMLSGPPGCGKTLLARHIAKKIGRPIYLIRFDSLISSFLGETSSNIKKVFEFARNNKIVLFFDEIDAVAKERSDSYELGELKRVVISILQNIDSLNRNTILIAATNHPQLLDSAMWRRFEIHWKMKPLGNKEMLTLLEKSGIEISNIDSDVFFKSTSGMSGAEFQDVISAAKRRIVLNNIIPNEALFLGVIDQLRRIIRPDTNVDLEQRLVYAFHGLKSCDSRKYTYSVLEDITGIPHSTIHHKMKNINL